MKMDEVQAIMTWLGTADFAKMPISEQLIVVGAITSLCETVRPLYEKHIPKKTAEEKAMDDLNAFLNKLLGGDFTND